VKCAISAKPRRSPSFSNNGVGWGRSPVVGCSTVASGANGRTRKQITLGPFGWKGMAAPRQTIWEL